MRVAVLSANPNTVGGYACQTKSLLRRLAQHPAVDDVAVASLRTAGRSVREGDYTVIPLGMDLPDGSDNNTADMARLVKTFAPDVVVSLIDVRFLGKLAAALAPAMWLPWVPIDCEPVSPFDVTALDGCHTAIAMARHGEEQLRAAGIPNVAYIPLGIEVAYTVLPDHEARRAFRAQLAGAECEHLTAIVAANTFGDRKNLPMQLAAWWAFSRNKPGARLYVHAGHRRQGAPDLAAVVRELGIEDKVIFAPNAPGKLTTAEMAQLYNAADVLMLCSRGEGFGVPIIEAQACGVPVVTTNFSAMPELLRWGQAVAVADVTYEPPLAAWWAKPDAAGILFALEELYDEWQACGGAWPLEQRREVSAEIHGEYGWDQVFAQHWAPLIQSLQSQERGIHEQYDGKGSIRCPQ